MNLALRFFFGATLFFAVFILPNPTFAIVIDGSVVPDTKCTIEDKNGAAHTFPKDNSPGGYLTVCALATALETGVLTSVQLTEFTGFGLFVEGLNGVVAGTDEYWALWRNGVMADCGIECLPVSQGDTVSFILTSFEGEERGSSVVLHVASQGEAKAGSSSGGGEFLKNRAFIVAAAVNYLTSQQQPDGSFGSAMLTEWAAIAFGAATDDVCDETCRDARGRLRLYVETTPTSSSSATDIERHIMALEVLGIDPHSAHGAPMERLIAMFDGTQIGDIALVNDDIFAIFPLLNAGYATSDTVPSAVLNFILSKQRANGSWEESVDLTAAAIQALRLFPTETATLEPLEKAEQYIRRNQDDSGIFGPRSFTLSWVLQAIAALAQTPEEWEKSGMTPLGYLGVLQQDDGGVEPMSVGADNRLWATSYAIPAALGKTWDSILNDFEKPVLVSNEGTVAGTSTAAVELHVAPPTPAPRKVAEVKAIPKPAVNQKISYPIATTTRDAVPAGEVRDTSSDNFSLALWITGVGLIVFFLAYVYLRKWVESLDV